MFLAKTLEAYLLLELATPPSERLRKCLRPDCPNPYFVARHMKQQYCSPSCAEWAQGRWRKEWWDQKGKMWLQDRRSVRPKRLLAGRREKQTKNQKRSLNLDNLARRSIAPTLKTLGIEWHGYYSLRRGCGTMATEAKGDNGLAAKSLLRHKNLATTTQFYVASISAKAREASELRGEVRTRRSEYGATWSSFPTCCQLSYLKSI